MLRALWMVLMTCGSLARDSGVEHSGSLSWWRAAGQAWLTLTSSQSSLTMHWSSVHPMLDVPHQTRGIGETGETGADQRGAVRGHGGLRLAEEDSATEERLAELPAVTTSLEDSFLDLKPKLPFNSFSFFSLQVLCM